MVSATVSTHYSILERVDGQSSGWRQGHGGIIKPGMDPIEQQGMEVGIEENPAAARRSGRHGPGRRIMHAPCDHRTLSGEGQSPTLRGNRKVLGRQGGSSQFLISGEFTPEPASHQSNPVYLGPTISQAMKYPTSLLSALLIMLCCAAAPAPTTELPYDPMTVTAEVEQNADGMVRLIFRIHDYSEYSPSGDPMVFTGLSQATLAHWSAPISWVVNASDDQWVGSTSWFELTGALEGTSLHYLVLMSESGPGKKRPIGDVGIVVLP